MRCLVLLVLLGCTHPAEPLPCREVVYANRLSNPAIPTITLIVCGP